MIASLSRHTLVTSYYVLAILTLSEMTNTNKIVEAIAKLLPYEAHTHAPMIAQFLTRLFLHLTETDSLSDFAIFLSENNDKVLGKLSLLEGKQIISHEAVFSFGNKNQFGDITVGDFAAGNIYKISLHFSPDANEKSNSVKKATFSRYKSDETTNNQRLLIEKARHRRDLQEKLTTAERGIEAHFGVAPLLLQEDIRRLKERIKELDAEIETLAQTRFP